MAVYCVLTCRSVYCVLGRCTYVRVVYCVLGRCTVCYGGVLYVGRWTVCYGGVLYVRAVYSMLWWCTVW